MSKKKHPEHVNHERWLVSYADFITLLFAFFVVLFASGQSDKRKQVKLAASMQSAFNHYGIFDPHSRTPPMAESGEAIQNATPAPVDLPLPTPGQLAEQANLRAAASASLPSQPSSNPKAAAEHISDVVRKQIQQGRLPEGVITIRPSSDGLVISLREAGFFASGSADVRPESLAVLAIVAAALPHQPIRVEGHTDNVPIHTAQFSTNWELSTARAASITRLLIAQGAADPTQISAAGYAEFRPIAPNDSDTGRTQNRRVDIVLLANSAAPPDKAAEHHAGSLGKSAKR